MHHHGDSPEVDGAVHDSVEALARDAARESELEALYGVRFVRVSAQLVERDVLAAVALVRAALTSGAGGR